MKDNNFPTVLIILGATGDLVEKKIVPSLYNLKKDNLLPKLFSVIGFSRRDLTQEGFRDHVRAILKSKEDDDFLKAFSYKHGRFENLEDYQDLAKLLGKVDEGWQLCANKLFYLAVPPKYYKQIFTNLAHSGLTDPCSPEEGWTRVIVEKPFGKDAKTAGELDQMLGDLFKEEQIYRIDHYLGKDMLQNILAFRFSNNIFEHSWSGKFIEKIEVKLLEENGVENRGQFYDGVGALRDVGQNHLLQMLSLVTLDTPRSFDAIGIRSAREEILKTLKVFDQKEVVESSFRAQYEGYQQIAGVKKGSQTETYFKLKGFLSHPRWLGVPFTLEAGKALGEQKKEIVVFFAHPHPCFCPPNSDHSSRNKVIFALEPKEEITFRLWSKKPGHSLLIEKRSFDLPYREAVGKSQYTQEYENLLLDCIKGDQTMFVSTSEVDSMWKFTDPFVSAWEKERITLNTYKRGSTKIRQAAKEKINKESLHQLKHEIGIVGLGKMGSGIARSLLSKGWLVVGYNRGREAVDELGKEGMSTAYSFEELVEKLKPPRIVWLMVPAGEAATQVIKNLSEKLSEGDFVIDGGNSFYGDTIKNERLLSEKGINFVDVGVSGGPSGARYGACLMVGGVERNYRVLAPLFVDLAVPGGQAFFEGIGAGHFVKMVHNGIEYGMMQALAEGMDILKNSDYRFKLSEIAKVYNHGSVIESRLVEWLGEAFGIFQDDLDKVSGSAGSGGAAGMEKSEAKWTLDVANKLGVSAKVIEEAITARLSSQEKPSYQGKVINALRNRFGGHSIEESN